MLFSPALLPKKELRDPVVLRASGRGAKKALAPPVLLERPAKYPKKALSFPDVGICPQSSKGRVADSGCVGLARSVSKEGVLGFCVVATAGKAAKERIAVRCGVGIARIESEEGVISTGVDSACARTGEEVIRSRRTQHPTATDVVLSAGIDVARNIQLRAGTAGTDADVASVGHNHPLHVGGHEPQAGIGWGRSCIRSDIEETSAAPEGAAGVAIVKCRAHC